MVENPPQATIAPSRFWNVKAASFFGLVAMLCVLIVVFRGGLVAFASLLLALFFLQMAWARLIGVSLTGAEISFPRSLIEALPFLVLGRMHRAIAELEEITYVGSSFGSEWVVLRFDDGQYRAPFTSRAQRLAFFEAVQTKKSNVRIYRAY